MSWTAYEYLHQVLLLNKTSLPATAQVGSLVLSFAFCCLCFIVWSSTYLVRNRLLQCQSSCTQCALLDAYASQVKVFMTYG